MWALTIKNRPKKKYSRTGGRKLKLYIKIDEEKKNVLIFHSILLLGSKRFHDEMGQSFLFAYKFENNI